LLQLQFPTSRTFAFNLFPPGTVQAYWVWLAGTVAKLLKVVPSVEMEIETLVRSPCVS
jgi:hypothetical protein